MPSCQYWESAATREDIIMTVDCTSIWVNLSLLPPLHRYVPLSLLSLSFPLSLLRSLELYLMFFLLYSLVQGLIARGDHLDSLVEKDRQLRVLFDEQVTGFERITPTNGSLPSDTRSWPQVTKRSPRPNTLVPTTNGHHHHHPHGKTAGVGGPVQPTRVVLCPTCSAPFNIDSETCFSRMFEHVSYCGPKTLHTELSSTTTTTTNGT